MNSSVTVEQLKRAVEIKEQIEQLNAELASILGGQETGNARPAVAGVQSGKRRGMSAAARAKIAAAQRARWAKAKGNDKISTTNASAKPGKRKGMSAAGRAKIAAAAKARWAKAKAAGKNAL